MLKKIMQEFVISVATQFKQFIQSSVFDAFVNFRIWGENKQKALEHFLKKINLNSLNCQLIKFCRSWSIDFDLKTLFPGCFP